MRPSSKGLRAAVRKLLKESEEPLTMDAIVSALRCRFDDGVIKRGVETMDANSLLTVMCARLLPGEPIVYTLHTKLEQMDKNGRLGEIRDVPMPSLESWRGWVSGGTTAEARAIDEALGFHPRHSVSPL